MAPFLGNVVFVRVGRQTCTKPNVNAVRASKWVGVNFTALVSLLIAILYMPNCCKWCSVHVIISPNRVRHRAHYNVSTASGGGKCICDVLCVHCVCEQEQAGSVTINSINLMALHLNTFSASTSFPIAGSQRAPTCVCAIRRQRGRERASERYTAAFSAQFFFLVHISFSTW